MRKWFERWAARRAFRTLLLFHDLNMHKFNPTESAYLVLTLDKIRSVMHED